jgi:hypothetical protein
MHRTKLSETRNRSDPWAYSTLLVSILVLVLWVQARGLACESEYLLPHTSVAETVKRLAEQKWPSAPVGANLSGYAVIEVNVSSDGHVCALKRIGGHPLVVGAVEQAVKTWTFSGGKAFVGVLVIRYSAGGYQLL